MNRIILSKRPDEREDRWLLSVEYPGGSHAQTYGTIRQCLNTLLEWVEGDEEYEKAHLEAEHLYEQRRETT